MTILQSIFLGALQGVAEFLPISSSGHLALCKALFGLEEVPLLFDIMLHIATLAAVFIFFRKEIGELLAVFYRWITRKAKEDDFIKQRMILAVIFGTISTGVIAIITQKFMPELPIKFICGGFIITAFLLILSSIISKRQIEKEGLENTVSPFRGFLIGIAQGIGTLPGISRSGITISASLIAGVERKTAGEFSFILSIPAIIGAFILEAKDLGDVTSTVGILPLIIGCLVAFVVGILSLKFLMKLINKGKLEYFAFYLIPVGILGLIFL